MNLKLELVNDRRDRFCSITDLSKKYAISRPTVYKWLMRHERLGINGLLEESRAPKHCPHRTSKAILDLVVQEKLKNRKRGPRKIRAQLKRQHPNLELPAISTLSYWLKKEGLVEERKKRLRVPPYSEPLRGCDAPNNVWSIDYKGQFHTKNGRICYPLTLSDNYSRFLLKCTALPGPRYVPTREVLVSAFREYGLPDTIRSDNGTPFANKCIGGLSRLSIWFIKLGIKPERIKKGCPQENGRHERMHRTLKSDVLDPIAKNIKDQQRLFDIFRHDYNNHRPHEALNDQTPNDYYKKSSRPYVEHPHPPEYKHDYIVRWVRQSGDIRLNGRMFFLTESLAKEYVGLKEIADGIWQLQYGFYILGTINLKTNKIIRS
jgi:transposase InsO family protein